jgi:hypothetical protein
MPYYFNVLTVLFRVVVMELLVVELERDVCDAIKIAF